MPNDTEAITGFNADHVAALDTQAVTALNGGRAVKRKIKKTCQVKSCQMKKN